MLTNLINETKASIAKFIDCDKVVVEVKGATLEVRSNGFVMFCYNYVNGRVVQGMAHKVGFTPARLYDLGMNLRAAV